MKDSIPRYEIRPLDASFKDASQETAFRTIELDSAAPYLKMLLPTIGAGFTAFTIPDLIVLGLNSGLLLTLATRIAFLAMTIYSSFNMKPGSPLAQRERTLSATTFVGVAAFGVALYAYKDANFHLQAMSVALMIIGVYLIPNRFLISVLASSLLAGMGLLSMITLAPVLSPSERAAYFVDFPLIVLLSSAVWRTTCRARRREYAQTQDLEWMSKTDLLTGIGNRRDFEERLTSALAHRRRYDEKIALVLLDIDRFKDVNDSFGHQAGDDILREIVLRLKANLRAGDSLARWGGEEFILLLPRTDAAPALDFADRMRKEISKTPFGRAGNITASFGITLLRAEDGAEDAFKRADRALYRAKESGRNAVQYEG